MQKVRVQQFNPESKCWNTLYEIPFSEYYEGMPARVNRYNGPYRYQIIGEPAATESEITLTNTMEFGKDGVEEDPIVETTPRWRRMKKSKNE